MKLPAFFRTQKFYSLFNSVFNSGIALISFALLARALSKEEFGYWAFFLAVYGFFEMAFNGLIRTPMIRMAAMDTEYNYDKVLASAWDILIKMALLCGILGSIGFLGFYWYSGNAWHAKFAYWFPLYMILSLPQVMGMWNSNALMRFQRVLVIRAVMVSLFLIGVLYVYVSGKDLAIVFWFYLFAVALASGLVLVKGWASFRSYLATPKAYRREMLDFGKFSMGATLGASGLSSSDTFVIMYFLGPQMLAIYEIPRRILGLYDIPLRAVIQLSYPYFSRRLKKDDSKYFRVQFERIGGFTFLVFTPVAILIFIFSETLVTFLGGEEYIEASLVLKIFSIYLIVTPLSRLSGVILDVLNKPKVNFNKLMIMLICNITGDILVIQLGYGVVGVAWVTVVMATIGVVYGYFMHRYEVPFHPLRMMKNSFVQANILLREIFM